MKCVICENDEPAPGHAWAVVTLDVSVPSANASMLTLSAAVCGPAHLGQALKQIVSAAEGITEKVS